MLPAPTLIIQCPYKGCTAHYRVRQYYSGNTFGAQVWTDGRIAGPMLPEVPEITRCDSCGGIFWVDRAPTVAQVEWGDPSDPWHDTPDVRFLTPQEYLEALASPALSSNRTEEQRLRSLLWWADNDRYRLDHWVVRTCSAGEGWLDEEQVRQNRTRLFELLDEREPANRLAKAELARELGWFAVARELLDGEWPEEYREQAAFIRNLAEMGNTEVCAFPHEEAETP